MTTFAEFIDGVVDHGKLLEDAPPAQFFEQPQDPRAQSFLRQVL